MGFNLRRLLSFLLLLSVLLKSTHAGAENEPYFLSLKQKGQLFSQGALQDGSGQWYNIYLIPGFKKSAADSRGFFKLANSSVSLYWDKDYYGKARVAIDNYGQYMFDGSKSLFFDFTLAGTSRRWKKNMSSAERVFKKRSFGYWFSYPWYITYALVDNAVRIPGGTAISFIGVLLSYPVAYTAGPVVTAVSPGVGYVGAGGVGVLSFTGNASWTALAGVPLSLFGQRPSPERSDGWWVKKISPPNYQEVSSSDINGLYDWGVLVSNRSAAYDKRLVDIDRMYADELEALKIKLEEVNTLISKEKAVVAAEKESVMQQLVVDYTQSLSSEDMVQLSPSQIRQNRSLILDAFINTYKLDPVESKRLLDRIEAYPIRSDSIGHESTNPVQEAEKVLRELPVL